MDYKLHFALKKHTPSQLIIRSVFCKKSGKDKIEPILNSWDSDSKKAFKKLKNSDIFKGSTGDRFFFSLENGSTVLAIGLGEKNKLTNETLRKEFAKIYKTFFDLK